MITTLLLAAAAWAGPLALDPASKLWLDGDSTLHKFQSKAAEIDVAAESEGGDLAGAARGGNVKKLELTIPVAQLKSGEKGLDKNLQKALKAEEHPTIAFRLAGYELPDCKPDAASCKVKATGKLSIAGVEKDASLEGDLSFVPDGLEVKGSKELLMTEFGVKPPTLMLGAIKVKDKIVVGYDIVIRPSKPARGGP
jgi:polyisoprenoid-binding protein YceI